jgi:hypothetical protein
LNATGMEADGGALPRAIVVQSPEYVAVKADGDRTQLVDVVCERRGIGMGLDFNRNKRHGVGGRLLLENVDLVVNGHHDYGVVDFLTG